MDLIKILEMWIEITGVNPNDSRVRLRDMDVDYANRTIKKSLEVDKSSITTLMLLESYLKDFTQDRILTLEEIIEDYDTVTAWTKKIKDFRMMIRSEEMLSIREQFKESLMDAIQHYKVHPDVVEKTVNNEELLAVLRFSAFNALNTLEIAQFSHGEPSQKTPVVYEDVYRFSDINTLLRWMMGVESGIILALIQDTNDMSDAYFVYAIRNGGTLTILTDRQKTGHPLHSQMSRSRAKGRSFSERIDSYYFPYDSLMDIEFGDNDRAYASSSANSVAIREDGIRISPINLLQPDEMVWIVMMFGLINEKFFKDNYKALELSYTPKMMMETDLLLKEAEENGIVIYGYKGLEVQKLTHDELRSENVKEHFDGDSSGKNDWLIDRYQISDDILDVLPNDNEKANLYLQNGKELATQEFQIEKMNGSYFANEDRLTKDRIYLARYNQARAINVQLGQEYRERKNEVIQWYEQALHMNLQALLEAMAKGRFIVDDKNASSVHGPGFTMRQKDGNILYMLDKTRDGYQSGVSAVKIAGKYSEWGKYNCAYNDTKASYVGLFYPTNASMLANLCGCEVSELHELLQHWILKPRFHNGNPISSRVDPMDYKIKNPWNELNLSVRVYLSKSGYNALCKKQGIEKDMFWLEREAYQDAKVPYDLY